MTDLKKITPPVAEKVPHKVHFMRLKVRTEVQDPSRRRASSRTLTFWLRDDERKNEKVLAHLRLENEYAKQELSHFDDLRKELYDEHISHLKETDDKAPSRHNKYFYYARTVKGLSYSIFCRKPVVGTEPLFARMMQLRRFFWTSMRSQKINPTAMSDR